MQLIAMESSKEQILEPCDEGKNRACGANSTRPKVWKSKNYSRTRGTHSIFVDFVLVAAFFILIASEGGWSTVAAQKIGVDICACQPSLYTFILDFSLRCNTTTVTPFQNGIGNVTCTVVPELDQNITNFSPLVVTRVEVYELDQNKDIIENTFIDGPYFNGTFFRYTSVITSQNANFTNPQDIPSGIQLAIYGINREEQQMINFWLIEFDNDCGIYPIILEGQTIGWTEMVS